jgi:hypothetical protein
LYLRLDDFTLSRQVSLKQLLLPEFSVVHVSLNQGNQDPGERSSRGEQEQVLDERFTS